MGSITFKFSVKTDDGRTVEKEVELDDLEIPSAEKVDREDLGKFLIGVDKLETAFLKTVEKAGSEYMEAMLSPDGEKKTSKSGR